MEPAVLQAVSESTAIAMMGTMKRRALSIVKPRFR